MNNTSLLPGIIFLISLWLILIIGPMILDYLKFRERRKKQLKIDLKNLNKKNNESNKI